MVGVVVFVRASTMAVVAVALVLAGGFDSKCGRRGGGTASTLGLLVSSSSLQSNYRARGLFFLGCPSWRTCGEQPRAPGGSAASPRIVGSGPAS